MSYSHHHHHHGNVLVGRMMVIGGCLLVLLADALLFRDASRPYPLPFLQLVTVISLIWMFTGAWGICTRTCWMRYLVLTILYAGSLGYFLAGIITVATADGPLVGRLKPIFIATAIYLYVSLVFTHSKHIRRLTSRALE